MKFSTRNLKIIRLFLACLVLPLGVVTYMNHLGVNRLWIILVLAVIVCPFGALIYAGYKRVGGALIILYLVVILFPFGFMINREYKTKGPPSVVWYYKAKSLANSDGYDAGIVAINNAISLDPSEKDYWYEKGSLLLKSGEPEKALEAYNQTLMLNRYFAPAWHKKGIALQKIGRPRAAKSALRKARLLRLAVHSFFIIGSCLVFFYGGKVRNTDNWPRVFEVVGALVWGVLIPLVFLWNTVRILPVIFGEVFYDILGGIVIFLVVAAIASAIFMSPKPARRGGSVVMFEGWWIVSFSLLGLAILFGVIGSIGMME